MVYVFGTVFVRECCVSIGSAVVHARPVAMGASLPSRRWGKRSANRSSDTMPTSPLTSWSSRISLADMAGLSCLRLRALLFFLA